MGIVAHLNVHISSFEDFRISDSSRAVKPIIGVSKGLRPRRRRLS